MRRAAAAILMGATACAPAKPAAEITRPTKLEAGGASSNETPSTVGPSPEPTTTVAVTTTATTTTTVAPFVMPEDEPVATDDEWWRGQPGYSGSLPLPPAWVSARESHDDYSAVNAAGYYGRWQFSRSTWNATAAGAGRDDLVGVRPDQASPADQDAMAAELWSDGAGCGAWNAC